ncbi:DUF2304 domain-containing protein [Paenibacillus sp. 1001270B_150601_E10]|uniref:DUF2304 domain-containing protein n=1 Tax=Paenibacillus sp. 1001270B_150601_E10 TaxID=2787079 RepID=UPI00189E1F07|nr:DUF2304 domain-containing protein [Paenibacillus sp. 1001270B_150601_E10]
MTIYSLSTIISIAFLLIIFELVRRQRLREQYSLLWIAFGVLLFIISWNVTLVEQIAEWLNVKYAPAILFLFGLLFCFAFILHLTLVITKLSNQVLRLTQEITLMKGKEQKHEQND